ncbi:S8 family serine peptidase [Lacinutrix neustonica]|uniref:S8 family serine peptidase n=1 Tax=Lacinutrix neustonica TaxID=2980107 RepID=A0A9E8SEZ0_9FLAO|nr:S8 family serine peptidase [Lacinutrix neustonica]WAC03726.1 S8 family serine peptidase [Lacinutrix neustonica]
MGNTNKENIIQANLEYVRIVRKFKSLYENKEIEDFSNIIGREQFTTYLNAKKALDKKAKKAKENYDYAYKVYQQYQEAKSSLKKYFPNYKYSEIKLNNIKITNPELTSDVEFMKQFLKYGESDQSLTKQMKEFDDLLFKRVNIDFNERTILNEDTDRLSDIGYGNNILNNNLNEYSHGTKIAGLIIGDNIKIMPLCVSPYGNEHDKDIAIAIRYAVDNGAKVINMSFSKNFSLFKEWVLDAIKYADNKNVLIVTSAGNDGLNINNRDNYPDDANGSGIEVSNNFLKIGATTYFVNSDLIDKYSNYGNSKVDVFAPGVDIYTAIPNNKYAYFSGTSLAAALTSKVAALIFSYYPNLSASQVKHIIMDSGVEYTFPVKTPTKEDKDKMTPFNELSKSR